MVDITKEEAFHVIKKSGVVGDIVISEIKDVLQRCDTCRQCWQRISTLNSQN